MPRYKNISGQALTVMTVQNKKKEMVVIPCDEEFNSDRETSHIKNMLAQKLVIRLPEEE